MANLTYTETNLKLAIKKVLEKYPVKEIYIPHKNDTHPDHHVVGNIVREVVLEYTKTPEIHEYIVHGKSPNFIKQKNLNEKKFDLISIFQSQFHDKKHQSFLEQFAYFPEVFYHLKN